MVGWLSAIQIITLSPVSVIIQVGDPYNTITIFRNAGFSLPVDFQTSQQYGDDISTWEIALIIAADPGKGAFGTPVITLKNPVIATDGSGSATFTIPAIQTPVLLIGTAYHYVVMHLPSGLGQQPVVDVYGRVKVIDAPPMP
jgi:hypothetical protein